MVETTKLELSLDELKILLTALYSFEQQLKDASTRHKVLSNIYKSEKFFNYDFDVESLTASPHDFLDEIIGSYLDKLFDAYYDLASQNNALKPLPPEDNRMTSEELFKFLELDLNAVTGAI